MRIVTWNVAGLNARLHRVKLWIKENQPDVLCLQETKMEDEVFQKKAQPVFEELGYESVHNGQKSWNGVAIISRVGIDDPQKKSYPISSDKHTAFSRIADPRPPY